MLNHDHARVRSFCDQLDDSLSRLRIPRLTAPGDESGHVAAILISYGYAPRDARRLAESSRGRTIMDRVTDALRRQ